MKVKIIENEMPEFESNINDFTANEDIHILNIHYSVSALPADIEYGWHVINMHNALITYTDIIKASPINIDTSTIKINSDFAADVSDFKPIAKEIFDL